MIEDQDDPLYIPPFLRRGQKDKPVTEALPAHSKIGASSSHRWIACPGSVALSADIPDESSEFAREGTAAHELAAECLRHDQDAWEHAGRAIKVEGDEFTVDDEMVAGVQVYLDAIRRDLTEYETGNDGEPVVFIEHQFHLADLHPDLFGTADCAIFFPAWGLLRVYDLKYGRGVVVEARENPQFLYYAAGVVHKISGDHDIEHVETVVVQPRAEHRDGPVRRWGLTIDSLGDWVASTLVPAAKRTSEPDAALEPGDHCRFCPARAICPKLAAEFDSIDPGAKPTSLSDEELAERLAKASVIRKYISALEDEAFSRISAGKKVPGFKLVPKKANRVWKDGAEDALLKKFGEEAFDKKLKTPPNIEKLRGGKKFVSEHAYKPDTGLTLAPEGDNRDGVSARTAAEVFKDV